MTHNSPDTLPQAAVSIEASLAAIRPVALSAALRWLALGLASGRSRSVRRPPG